MAQWTHYDSQLIQGYRSILVLIEQHKNFFEFCDQRRRKKIAERCFSSRSWFDKWVFEIEMLTIKENVEKKNVNWITKGTENFLFLFSWHQSNSDFYFIRLLSESISTFRDIEFLTPDESLACYMLALDSVLTCFVSQLQISFKGWAERVVHGYW